MKKRKTTLLLFLLLIIGLSLLLYPTVSDKWNSMHQSRAILDYSRAVTELSDDSCADIIAAANEYNASLPKKIDRYEQSEEEKEEYMSLLNVNGTGAMGYIRIPKINVTIPLYHTAENDVLQFAAGHIPGTSLPVGGKGTHCVISGHRGLPTARLFTDLDQLQEGDVFFISVLKETLSYEVDSILTVDPEDIEALAIDPENDYFTLVTCTPYGVNTHRLLVRGHRIENASDDEAKPVYFTSEAVLIDPAVAAPFAAIPFLILLFVFVFIEGRRKSKYPRRNDEENPKGTVIK